MLFNSLQYALFLPLALGGFYLLPNRFRVAWLLLASCAFYMAYRPAYILILALLIAIDYVAGLKIERAPRTHARRWLVLSILATTAVLFVFKYYSFVTGNVTALAGVAGIHLVLPALTMALPVGLSFHTFQSLAYVIEVYRGTQRASRNPLNYATYVMFFPQLVAGPIERPGELLHQFDQVHRFDAERAIAGLKRIAWGLFKKAVVADRLGVIVADTFGRPQEHSGPVLCLGALAFTWQIYCDFSGYTDMALGSAQLLGFELTENFADPFRARSVGEFWRRWHMSLSRWFRDYVFIPLGGSSGSSWQTARNYLITFTISGLWHGAAWTYVAWGALNGAALVVGRVFRPLRERFAALFGMATHHPVRATFATLVTFGFTVLAFVVFRAPSLGQAVTYFRAMASPWRYQIRLDTIAIPHTQFWLAIASVVFLEVVQWILRRPVLTERCNSLPVPVQWVAWLCFVTGTFVFGVWNAADSFIYFQF